LTISPVSLSTTISYWSDQRQTLHNPHPDQNDRQHAPHDTDNVDVLRQHADLLPDQGLFPIEVSLGLVENQVIVFLHILEAAPNQHDGADNGDGDFDEQQTRLSSGHFHLQLWVGQLRTLSSVREDLVKELNWPTDRKDGGCIGRS
jgi:hypothetical protein